MREFPFEEFGLDVGDLVIAGKPEFLARDAFDEAGLDLCNVLFCCGNQRRLCQVIRHTGNTIAESMQCGATVIREDRFKLFAGKSKTMLQIALQFTRVLRGNFLTRPNTLFDPCKPGFAKQFRQALVAEQHEISAAGYPGVSGRYRFEFRQRVIANAGCILDQDKNPSLLLRVLL